MFRFDVRTDISKAAAQMTKLASGVRDKATTRAINKVAAQGKTAAAREIKDQYQISSRVISKSISIRRAARGSLQAVVTAEGRPLPMIAFNARQSKTGVTVRIKGRTITVPHAFIRTMRSGHRGVFARGGYKGSFQQTGQAFGRFKFGRGRLPIGELFTVSVPKGFSNKTVQDKVMARVQEQFPKVLAQEINYLLLKK
ncbi:phage tail protein [Herbaspirillum rubrisubalbicans]|uniref:phage tail protein n=1 Tax=Herbaspirillum rubrisubalbicans TaxID=80842 RepID=UPI0015584711|nr:phage tail protein [Herbaspirillum rubrisubalbicans]NQE47990.1 hypothetical protein [Herbaspirillum rubrisubalbicans]